MSTQKSEPTETIDENGEVLSIELATDIMQQASVAVKSLAAMKPMISIKMEYKDFKNEKDSCRGVFLGYAKKPNKKGDLLDSIMWMEQDGRTYYNSGVILVGDCKRFNVRTGTAIEITYLGKKDVKGGNTAKNYNVMVLGEPTE